MTGSFADHWPYGIFCILNNNDCMLYVVQGQQQSAGPQPPQPRPQPVEHGAGACTGPRPRAAQRQHQLRQVNTGLLLAGAAGILTRDWPQRVHGQVQQLVPVLPAALPRLAQPRAAEAVRPELPQS